MYGQQERYIFTDSIWAIRYKVSTEEVIAKTTKTKSLNTIHITDDSKNLIIMNLDKEPFSGEKLDILRMENFSKGNVLMIYLKNEPEEENVISILVDKRVIIRKIKYKDEAIVITYFIK